MLSVSLSPLASVGISVILKSIPVRRCHPSRAHRFSKGNVQLLHALIQVTFRPAPCDLASSPEGPGNVHTITTYKTACDY